ncbi:MAG TPA: L-ribulose-5-phosphate 4-epimerase AraD [Candidatus Hydrogenedentes bacterium]|nr:L-ribulose-5-phosphate 4-epimerase AraD [Candidatus Hydrogenedentota bacterium]
MLERLRKEICEVNLELVRRGLVFQTWGNASGIDRKKGLVVIKPSGVSYAKMRPKHMVIVDIEGNVVEGELKPSVDTPTHLALYKAFSEIGGIVHTHSHYATCWAQARRPIPCFGTTHADYCHGEIPLADALTEAEVAENYEANIGALILRRYASLDPMAYPGVLAAGHGPFAWGRTPAESLENAAVMEELARMAANTLVINPDAPALEGYLLDKHFLRKHGAGAYYGQKKS